MEKFKSFITEAEDKPYRFVMIWYDDPEDPDDPEKTVDEFISEGKKIGCKGFKVDISGAYSDLVDDKRYIYDGLAEKESRFLVDENTLVFIRAPVTRRKSWSNLLTQLEREDICCVNNRRCMEVTSDKYRTGLVLAEQELTQPKTVLVHNQDKALVAFDRLDTKFPIILKTLTGSLGIGVIKIDTEESLSSTVQVLYKLDPDMGVLLQDMIKMKYDVRVHVVGGVVHGAIKRPVVEKDFRSNVSLGSIPEPHKLTDLEIEHCEQAAKAVDGLWVGVDFFPSTDREEEPPIFVEINSTPGTKGYKKATKENICGDILKKFMNRDIWLKSKITDSIYEPVG